MKAAGRFVPRFSRFTLACEIVSATMSAITIAHKNSKSLPPPNAVKSVDSHVLTQQLLNVSPKESDSFRQC